MCNNTACLRHQHLFLSGDITYGILAMPRLQPLPLRTASLSHLLVTGLVSIYIVLCILFEDIFSMPYIALETLGLTTPWGSLQRDDRFGPSGMSYWYCRVSVWFEHTDTDQSDRNQCLEAQALSKSLRSSFGATPTKPEKRPKTAFGSVV